MRNFIPSGILFLVLYGCKKEELNTSETIMRVNSFRQSCQGEGVFSCYLTQEGDKVGTNNWNLFVDKLKGFNMKTALFTP